MFVLVGIFAIPHFIVAWGLLNGAEWARIAGIIVSILSLLHPAVGLGTAIAIYSLVILFSSETEELFRRAAKVRIRTSCHSRLEARGTQVLGERKHNRPKGTRPSRTQSSVREGGHNVFTRRGIHSNAENGMTVIPDPLPQGILDILPE